MTPLRAWRLQRRWSVPQLAQRAGVLRETITDSEHGRRLPGAVPIARICAALDVAPDEVAEFATAQAAWRHQPRVRVTQS